MPETPVTSFPYTADRTPFRRALTAVGVLLLVAVPVALLLLQLVLPLPMAIAVDVALAAFTIALLVVAATPLFTAHRLEGDVLLVRYGVLLRAGVPTATIQRVRVVRRPVGILEPLLPSMHTGRATAVFGRHGQVLVELAEPCRVRLGLRSAAVRELVLTVDDPDGLRALLGRRDFG